MREVLLKKQQLAMWLIRLKQVVKKFWIIRRKMLNADMKMLRQVLILQQNNNFWFVFYIEKKALV